MMYATLMVNMEWLKENEWIVAVDVKSNATMGINGQKRRQKIEVECQ